MHRLAVELRLGGLISVGEHRIALGRTLALLDAVAETNSVGGAAGRLGLSYRTAWGRIEALRAAFGRPLVAKTKGHGSTLTPLGEAVRGRLRAALDGFAGPIAEAEAGLAAALNGLLDLPRPPLRLAYSHDPLLAAVLDAAEDVEAAVVGSLEAAARLIAGEADVAGFHHGDGPPPSGTVFETLSARPDVRIVPLFRREQGLIVAPGNPLGLGTVADLAARGARLVNRQRGSGTRLWLDRLLAEAGIAPASVRGYGAEEFTHRAVAAVVASGAADAGMGVRAAADALGLGFVPLGWETYHLAWLAEDDRLGLLVGAVRGRIAGAAGYAPPG